MSRKSVCRCPECRNRFASYKSLQTHLKRTGHKLCGCGGYHYKHRAGSPYCEQNTLSAMYLADREGAGPEDLRKIAEYIRETTPSAGAKASELLRQWGMLETD